jgi:hypothetical protein
MLAEFQQALADLTASPALCNAARRDAGLLARSYRLTPREAARLRGIVCHPGMECACMVYRANRLAPLALNLPRTCRALGSALRDVASEYWLAYPEGNVHFYIECDRFCGWLRARIDAGAALREDACVVLAEEAAAVAQALDESRLEAGLPALHAGAATWT